MNASLAPMDLPLDVRLMAAATQLLVFVLLVMAGAGVLLWVSRLPVWTLSGLSVHGDVAHQNPVALRAHLASRLSGNFLTLNLQEVKRLFESVPWVRQAVVQREFPNRLRVTLREHQAVAWWGEAGGNQLVSALGQRFEAEVDDPASAQWPVLSGPDAQVAEVHAMLPPLREAFARLQLDLSQLDLNPHGSWRATLDNGARIELGRGDQATLLNRVERFVATVQPVADRYQRALESADLRYPNGYAIRLRGVVTEVQPLPVPALKP